MQITMYIVEVSALTVVHPRLHTERLILNRSSTVRPNHPDEVVRPIGLSVRDEGHPILSVRRFAHSLTQSLPRIVNTFYMHAIPRLTTHDEGGGGWDDEGGILAHLARG